MGQAIGGILSLFFSLSFYAYGSEVQVMSIDQYSNSGWSTKCGNILHIFPAVDGCQAAITQAEAYYNSADFASCRQNVCKNSQELQLQGQCTQSIVARSNPPITDYHIVLDGTCVTPTPTPIQVHVGTIVVNPNLWRFITPPQSTCDTPSSACLSSSVPCGDGSTGNPYEIANGDHLQWIANQSAQWWSGGQPIQKTFCQVADISTFASGFQFIPTISGTYDGQNHKISNFEPVCWNTSECVWNASGGGTEYDMGFFQVAENATIKNLNFDGAAINVYFTTAGGIEFNTGILIGHGINVVLSNVEVNGSIPYVIDNSSSAGNPSNGSDYDIGTIAGRLDGTNSLTNVNATGSLQSGVFNIMTITQTQTGSFQAALNIGALIGEIGSSGSLQLSNVQAYGSISFESESEMLGTLANGPEGNVGFIGNDRGNSQLSFQNVGFVGEVLTTFDNTWLYGLRVGGLISGLGGSSASTLNASNVSVNVATSAESCNTPGQFTNGPCPLFETQMVPSNEVVTASDSYYWGSGTCGSYSAPSYQSFSNLSNFTSIQGINLGYQTSYPGLGFGTNWQIAGSSLGCSVAEEY